MNGKKLLSLWGLKWNPFSPELPSEGLLVTPRIESFAWRVEQLVQEGGFAYSSLAAGRPDTESEGWIYVNFEDGGSHVARFNLSWLLQGEPTGDGTIPEEFEN